MRSIITASLFIYPQMSAFEDECYLVTHVVFTLNNWGELRLDPALLPHEVIDSISISNRIESNRIESNRVRVKWNMKVRLDTALLPHEVSVGERAGRGTARRARTGRRARVRCQNHVGDGWRWVCLNRECRGAT